MLTESRPYSHPALRPARETEPSTVEAVWAASQDADEPLGRPRTGWWSITAWATMIHVLPHEQQIIGVAAVEHQATTATAEARVALMPQQRDWPRGAQLVEAAIALAREAGAAHVRLYAPITATWATFPARMLGFKRVRSQYTMLLPGDTPVEPPRRPGGIRIRALHSGEEDALLAALNHAWAGTWNARVITLPALLNDLHDQRDGMLVAVDVRNPERIVATSHARFDAAHTNPDGAPYAWISNLTTDPAWRGRGVGRAMLLAAIQHLRTRGARSIALGVDGGATIPLGLYQSVGFGSINTVDIWERSTRV